ncbi:hypothetical protein LJB98_01710 [Bacteroidales bacterium OttesenSCG-928-M11]|nr:hypothetical protein [Bacteroidales bacterium OttesenSCG-928-M11]
MSLLNEKQNRIDAYLRNELTEAERSDFEQEVCTDKELRETLEVEVHIREAFIRKGEQKALDQLKQLTPEEFDKLLKDGKPKKKTGTIVWLPIVASVAALFIISFLIFRSGVNESQALFYAYYQTEELEISPSRGYITEDELQNQNLYMSSLEILESGDLPSAIDNFNTLAALSDFEYREEAEWILALAYLKNNQKKESILVLDKIIAQEGYFADRAQKLKDELK